jgi:hypothetical protein
VNKQKNMDGKEKETQMEKGRKEKKKTYKGQ